MNKKGEESKNMRKKVKFKQKFNENPIYLFREELSKLFKEELIEIDLDQIKLTRKGLDLANLVWEEFID